MDKHKETRPSIVKIPKNYSNILITALAILLDSAEIIILRVVLAVSNDDYGLM